MRLMDPQPKWEEVPERGSDGEWCGRYRYFGGDPQNPECCVDVDAHLAPEDMSDAEPLEIDLKWYWVMLNNVVRCHRCGKACSDTNPFVDGEGYCWCCENYTCKEDLR